MAEMPSKGRGRVTAVGVVTREVAAIFGFSLAALFWAVGDAPEDSAAARGLLSEFRPNTVSIDSLQVGPGGDSLVVSGRDGRVGVLGLPGGRPVRAPLAMPMGETITALSHDGRTLAVASQRGGVRLVSLEADEGDRAEDAGRIPLPEVRGQVHALDFSPDDRLIAFGTADGELVVWDRRAERILLSSPLHSKCLHTVAFAPDGRSVATGGMDGRVLVHDLASGSVAELPLTRPHAILRVAFSPDGLALAAAGRDTDYLTVWDVPSRRVVAEPRGPEFCTSALAFSPDGRHLFAGGAHCEVVALSTRSWERVRSLPAHPAWVKAMALTPDGRRLAVGTADGHVRVWDVEKMVGNG